MRIYYSSKFNREYKNLPIIIKNKAKEAEKLFRNNPFSHRLRTHKLSGKFKDFWSFSVNSRYRIIFEFYAKDVVWFHSMGDHSVYQ